MLSSERTYFSAQEEKLCPFGGKKKTATAENDELLEDVVFIPLFGRRYLNFDKILTNQEPHYACRWQAESCRRLWRV
jgi:hypothetical protein